MVSDMTASEYEEIWWPKLVNVVSLLIKQKPGDVCTKKPSYEEAYSAVFRVVLNCHAHRLYSDLVGYLEKELTCMNDELNTSPQQEFLLKFHAIADQYLEALKSIIPVFSYLDRQFVQNSLRTNLRQELLHLFYKNLVEPRQQRLFESLSRAQTSAFTVPPYIMSKLVNNLNEINPTLHQIHPDLFMLYVPPKESMRIDQLPGHIHQVRVMQQQLRSDQDFRTSMPEDGKRKREDESPSNMNLG